MKGIQLVVETQRGTAIRNDIRILLITKDYAELLLMGVCASIPAYYNGGDNRGKLFFLNPLDNFWLQLNDVHTPVPSMLQVYGNGGSAG